MSRYDDLDARTQLEQTLAAECRRALTKRGWEVIHHGTADSHAPAGRPDIELRNANAVVTIEATRSKGAAQDREFNSIVDHLRAVKAANGRKRCYCIFVSPETAPRMLFSIRDHNARRAEEGVADMKVLPLSFVNIDLWLTRLVESEADLYPVLNFLRIYDRHPDFVDDLRVRKLLYEYVFPGDEVLAEGIRREEVERDTQTLEQLVRDLSRLENYMRQNGVATAQDAIDTLIYLVFLKLYEEKRERDGRGGNRLRSVEVYQRYLEDAVSARERKKSRGIHRLFDTVKHEGTFLESQMFTENTVLRDEVTDTFIVEHVLPIFVKYNFLGTGIDALGAVYEVLAQRASKDVKVGQFFTPENVVRFIVQLGELQPTDLVLDPACGTGRFLIQAMHEMVAKVDRARDFRDKEGEKERIRKQRLIGADIDNRIAKIARMNMWINGDGKSNIFDGNGLLLHRRQFGGHESFDGQFDVVLTNPPLGELNYQNTPFTDAEEDQERALAQLTRSPFLPRRDRRDVDLKKVSDRLAGHQGDLVKLNEERAKIEADVLTPEETERDDEIRRTLSTQRLDRDARSAYRNVLGRIDRKRSTIVDNEGQLAQLRAARLAGAPEWEVTGNTMKGGAMFLSAIWHYLKDRAYPDEMPEWRGGKMLVVLDEGILNTESYSPVRDFLRKHFYIKAIISLTRDTFVPISKTSTKTSIVYAIKKTDPDAVQREPIFFAHADRVGLDTKGNAAPNDLEKILEQYRTFKEAVLEAYVGREFRRERYLNAGVPAAGVIV